ncbi:MAG: protein translocase subunit SecD [Pseudomonadota bacterium]
MSNLPRWQRITILIATVLAIFYAAPNVIGKQTLDSLPDWIPHEQINLGLDLRGGAYLLTEADLDALEVEQLRDLSASILVLLRQDRIGVRGLGVRDEQVQFALRDPERADQVLETLRRELPDLEISRTGERFRVNFSDLYLDQQRNNVMEQAILVLNRRLDETGTRALTIQRQGFNRILIQVPGIENPQELKDLIGQTAKLTFRFVLEGVDPTRGDRIPAGASLLPSEDLSPSGQPMMEVISDRVIVSGENLTDAQPSFDTGSPVVLFRFDAFGGQRFCDATRANVGRRFAIVLDDTVISAPVIRDAICGGSGQISGNFTVEEAQQLSLFLRAGALPTPLTIIEERSVGPGLGADSIAAGEIASVVGVVLVVFFMALIYGRFGLLADVALILNLIIIVGVLTALQATLTLPGIAGIALTMGMAVDANVLIFERIREEARNGRTMALAIDAGFKRAITTIIDSNVTTLIAALLLYQFGSGPIRGFAVTLSLGLASSMFCAIFVTRWMVLGWARRQKRGTRLPIA